MKGAKRDMKIILMFFLKEILFRAIWSFWNKNGMVSSSLWIWSQVFLLILLKKRNQEVHEIFFSCFLRKNFFWSNLIFSSHFLMFDWVWSKWSQATVTIGSLKSQDMIKILKQSGHDFSGKRLCDGYCSEILCDVYLSRSIFNRGHMVFWRSFFKNLLRNFVWMYRSLNAKNL